MRLRKSKNPISVAARRKHQEDWNAPTGRDGFSFAGSIERLVIIG
jgi:hypothetical protein